MTDVLKEPGILQLLYRDFIRSKKTFIQELENAIEAKDFNTAHIMTHTLKGGSGIIGEHKLSELAKQVELNFKSMQVCRESIDKMNLELEHVLAKIKPDIADTFDTGPEITGEKALDILDKVFALLSRRDTNVRFMIADIKRIPKSDNLVYLIEDYDFAAALKALEMLRIHISDF